MVQCAFCVMQNPIATIITLTFNLIFIKNSCELLGIVDACIAMHIMHAQQKHNNHSYLIELIMDFQNGKPENVALKREQYVNVAEKNRKISKRYYIVVKQVFLLGTFSEFVSNKFLSFRL